MGQELAPVAQSRQLDHYGFFPPGQLEKIGMSTGNSLVSIIIPTHNSRQWVAGAIDCALAQTHPHCEVIVVDDGSTDETEDYLNEKYREQIRYIYKPNSGPASARNMGISVAKGEFIQFLDSDDFLAPDKIERQMAVFRDCPECDVVYSDFAFVFDGMGDKREESPASYATKYRSENVFESLLDGNFIVIHSPLTRASVIRSCGGFDESLSSDEDYDLWLKIAGRGHRFCFVPEVLAFYQRRGNSVSTNLLKQSQGTLQALIKARSYREKLSRQEAAKLRLNLSREYGWTSRHYLRQGDYSMARTAILKSISNNPLIGVGVAIDSFRWWTRQQLGRHLLWRFRGK